VSYQFEPVRVRTGSPDEEGLLVLRDERLVAVLVRLSEQHAEDAGKWVVEAGFAFPDTARDQVFTELDDAEAWFNRHIGDR
jgi:hypothetical protein